MDEFRLLVVEDNEGELQLCRNAVTRYLDEKNRKIVLVECRTLDEVWQKLDNSFDGAIIDLKLASGGNEGNTVVEEITNSYLRIPMIIFTGTPNNANTSFSYIGIFKKGEIGYIELFDNLWGIYKTGLTRIVGGRGIIEKTLNDVFIKNIIPQVESWISYGEVDSERTERALLRHTINHLLQLLDNDEDKLYPEEVYIYPSLDNKIRSGSIIKKKNEASCFIVLNPACDLVIRQNGKCNTDHILLVSIDNQISMYPWILKEKPSGNQLGEIKNAYSNKKTIYHHWLPQTNFFEGGFINFRKLFALNEKEFFEGFEKPLCHISPSFTKDIIARFSAFYARQGQPEIYYDDIINSYIAAFEEKD